MKICVVIPAYNEAKTIGPLVESIKKKGLDVFVIDDGSKDNCGVIAKSKGADVLRLDPNQGKGNALKCGFKYALEKGYDGVIMMDSDGQHDVEDLDHFIAYSKEFPLSVITGNRMTNTKEMPRVRYLTNRFMSSLISLACRNSIADTQCGYRDISCDVLKNLHLTCADFEIETEILMKCSKKNFKVYSVSVKTIYQDEKSHINPLKDTIRFFVYFLKEIFSSKEK